MSDRDLDLSSPSTGYDEQIRPYVEILKSLFSCHLTPETAAAKLAVTTVPDPNIDREECEENIQVLWDVILWSLCEESARLETIANLIYCISRLPPPITKSGEQLTVDEGGQRVWNDTPTLRWALRDEWNLDFGQGERQAVIDRFVHMNTLVASLMAYDDQVFDYHSFTLYTFRNALEYTAENPESNEEDPNSRQCHISAATRLVEIVGQRIYHWDFEFESGRLIGDRGKGGVLWDGKHGFCKERWKLWKRRFFEVSFEEELSDRVRSCAREAGEGMSRIDGSSDSQAR